jgi:hypothetical protein
VQQPCSNVAEVGGELDADGYHVSSFANTDLESFGGYGYIIFGVSNAGRVVGVGGLTGDPLSDAREMSNNYLRTRRTMSNTTAVISKTYQPRVSPPAITLMPKRRPGPAIEYDLGW